MKKTYNPEPQKLPLQVNKKEPPQSAEAPTLLPTVLPEISEETPVSASEKPMGSLKSEPIPTVRGESTAQTQKLSGTAAVLASFGINAIKEDKEETPGTKPADSP